MPATSAAKTAVAQSLLGIIRKLDLEGYLNQDNPTKVGTIYPITSMTFGNTTVVELASSAIASLFCEKQVVKFFNISDTTLADELSDLNTSQKQRTIIEISGANLTLNLDSSNFSGTFVSGDISATIDMSELEDIAGYIIADFELDTGIDFDYTSHIHLSLARDIAYLNFSKISGGERLLVQTRYDERVKKLLLAKGLSYTAADATTEIEDYNKEGEFTNDDFKLDLGLSTNDPMNG